MLDFSWTELFVVGAVALVVIPPKDLPRALHALGKFVARARAVAHDFRLSMDRLSYEVELSAQDQSGTEKPQAAQTEEMPESSNPLPPQAGS